MIYLGKRVEVKIQQRDNYGNNTLQWTTVCGTCQSEPQENKRLGIDLQIVIDRMPITIKSLNDVKILEK